MPSTRARTSAVRTACSRPGSSMTLAIGSVPTVTMRTSGGGGAAGGADLEQAATSSAAPTRRAWAGMVHRGRIVAAGAAGHPASNTSADRSRSIDSATPHVAYRADMRHIRRRRTRRARAESDSNAADGRPIPTDHEDGHRGVERARRPAHRPGVGRGRLRRWPFSVSIVIAALDEGATIGGVVERHRADLPRCGDPRASTMRPPTTPPRAPRRLARASSAGRTRSARAPGSRPGSAPRRATSCSSSTPTASTIRRTFPRLLDLIGSLRPGHRRA